MFIDGRNIMYGRKLTETSLTLQYVAPGWERLLKEYRIGWALYPTDAPIVAALKRIGWKPVYSDSTATVLVRP
ncbi:MAG: hypothetical protein HY303_00875 [Candidatus Wallbacteria bacterium]|nr:hypothetical protein [Candidatus Wallbacteria bacterium]